MNAMTAAANVTQLSRASLTAAISRRSTPRSAVHLLEALAVFGHRTPKRIKPHNETDPFKLLNQLRGAVERIQ